MKIIVEQYEKGILFRDGRFVQVLDPGRFAKFDPFRRLRVVKVDTRIRTFVIQNQEIMTADKVTLRMNALVKHRIADPVAAVLAVDDVHAQLYGDAQLALRAELYEKSPMLLRLRELEALEKVLGAAGRTIVLAPPGDLLGSLLKK